MAIDESEVKRLADAGKMNELKKEYLKLTAAEQDALKNSNTLAQNYIDLLEMAEQNLRRNTLHLQAQIDKLKLRGDLEDKSYAGQQRRNALAQQKIQIQLNELEDLRELIKTGQDADEDRLKDLAKREDALNRIARAQEASAAGTQSMGGAMREINPMAVKMADNFALMAAAAEDGTLGVKGIAAAGAVANNVLSKVFDTVKSAIFGLDEATNAFERQYQMGPKYSAAIKSTTTALNEAGVSASEAASAYGGLITNFTDFTTLNTAQQKSLGDTAAIMAEVGVTNEDFGKSAQSMNKFFGVATEDMGTQMSELAGTARALGVPTGQLAGQFANAGGAMAKFGDQGIKAFKDLARVQKITGMEMEKVLSITNRFDTFEGAAEQAGKLNAALGGNFVNAMDLMTSTDPAERFGMIRDSILDAGLSFDEMSYYQKQFYTESLGLSDVGDLAMMLSGDMTSLAGAADASAESLIEQKERAQGVQSIMEKMQSILVDNADAFLGLAEAMSKILGFLQKKPGLIKVVIAGMIALKTVTFALAFAQMFMGTASHISEKGTMKLGLALGILALAAGGLALAFMIASPSKLVLAMFSFGASLHSSGAAADKSAASFQRLAPALLQVGVGIFLITGGLALMAAAFSLLNVEQMIGMGAILIGIGVGAYFLAPALTALGAALANPVVIVGLAVFAATILSIGASIFLAATGVGLMGAGMSLMFKEMDVPKVLAFGAMVLGLIIGAPFLAMAGAGLFAMALGMGALGFSLKFIATKDLEAIAQFATGLAELEVNQISSLAKAIRQVAKAMDDIPTHKAILMTATMESATVAASAARILAGQAPKTSGDSKSSMNSTAKQPPININLTVELGGEVLDNRIIKVGREQEGSGGAWSAISGLLGQ
tara:strand:- start:1255 stop:3924 length:2670 start_codon:yes stop_codon:yes gene_type:complete